MAIVLFCMSEEIFKLPVYNLTEEDRKILTQFVLTLPDRLLKIYKKKQRDMKRKIADK